MKNRISFFLGVLVSLVLCGTIVYGGYTIGGDVAAIFVGPTALLLCICITILLLTENGSVNKYIENKYRVHKVEIVTRFAAGYALATPAVLGTCLLFFILSLLVKA